QQSGRRARLRAAAAAFPRHRCGRRVAGSRRADCAARIPGGAAGAGALRARPGHPRGAGMSGTGQQRVLIVDDEPANIHGLAEALGGGYDLRFATSGERALDLATTLPFDLILLDVVMPGMDGFEVLRRLKDLEATRAVPVIFVTSKDDVAD